jgi:hypothetical protein
MSKTYSKQPFPSLAVSHLREEAVGVDVAPGGHSDLEDHARVRREPLRCTFILRKKTPLLFWFLNFFLT